MRAQEFITPELSSQFRQLFKSTPLLEDRIQFIKDKNKDLTAEHDHFAAAKTANEIIDYIAEHADPTRSKVYTQWLVKQYKLKQFRQEDAPIINDTLVNFEKHKAKLTKKDINQYASLRELKQAVAPHVGTAATNKEKNAEIIRNGIDKLYDSGQIQIYHVKTKAASQAVYGGGANLGGNHTDWCTAFRRESCRFDEYTAEGPLHAIHVANDPLSPYQIHQGKEFQLMDRNDNPVEPDDFTRKHPELVGSVLSEFYFQFASTDQLQNKEYLLSVVSRNGEFLGNIPEKSRTSEMCTAAVKNNGYALEYVPQELRTSEICLAAVQQNGYALRHVPKELQTGEICMAAVKNNGKALYYVSLELRTGEICMAAVRQDGFALHDVPLELQTSEICMAAVTRHGLALQFVPRGLRTLEMYVAAAKSDRAALFYAPDNLGSIIRQQLARQL